MWLQIKNTSFRQDNTDQNISNKYDKFTNKLSSTKITSKQSTVQVLLHLEFILLMCITAPDVHDCNHAVMTVSNTAVI